MKRLSQRFSTGWALLGALPLLLVGAGALAGPAPSPDAKAPKTAAPTARTSTAPGQAQPDAGGGGGSDVDKGADMGAARAARAEIESGVSELESMSEGAKADGDAVRAACVQDKVDHGRDVMEVATGEILILRDAKATGREKSLASEKLQAAAERMKGLVKAARACSGDQAPEEQDNVTRNELDEQQNVPLADPTQPGVTPPVPSPVDPTTPQTVASPSQ